MLADIMGACVATLVTYAYLRSRNIGGGQRSVTLLTCGIILVVALALLLRSRQYSITRGLSTFAAIGTLVRDILIAGAITTFASYITKGFFTGHTTPSRLSVALVTVVFFAIGVLARLLLGILQRRQYAAGQGVRRIIVAGGGTAAADLLELLALRPDLGVVAAGSLHLDIPEWPAACAGPTGLPALRVSDNIEGLRQLDQLLRSTRATEVVAALDPDCQGAVPKLATFLSLAHIPFRVVPSLFEDTYRAGELLGHSEIRVVDLGISPLDRVGRIFKRAMDICVSALVVVLLFPLWLSIGLAIIAESGFPVIFIQERVGKNGRRFRVYKFRTMVKDAEAKLKDLEAHNELPDANGRMFKMRRDPRITPVGSVLRKCSLDELPQFVNVLKGDMSLVGPRPPLPREVAKYERDHLYRLRTQPGITGLWQVSGRNELSFEDMVRLDRYYVDNWSLGLDVRIVFKTFAVLVSRKGAY